MLPVAQRHVSAACRLSLRSIGRPRSLQTPSRRPWCDSPSYIRKQSTTSTSSDESPISPNDVIFSGIQPTGIPHLGNYLGALREWVKLQNSAPASTSFYFSVVDLHALTGSQDAAQLRQWKRETMAALISVGLKPGRCVMFYQSDVTAHSELMWILSGVASMGYLSRMTQWKSKLSLPDSAKPDDKSARDRLKLGLFSYPVLQAADILVHRATLVPVGSDQAQHLEFARTLATSFNHHYSTSMFPIPNAQISSAKRIMSLKDPSQKMSKSAADPRSRILISDSEDIISDKVRLALTDSIEGVTYNPDKRPGVSNLLELLSHFSPRTTATDADVEYYTPQEIALEFKDSSMRVFKEVVVDTVAKAMQETRESFRELTETSQGVELVETVAGQGAADAGWNAGQTLEEVRKAVGLD